MERMWTISNEDKEQIEDMLSRIVESENISFDDAFLLEAVFHTSLNEMEARNEKDTSDTGTD